MPSEDVDIGVIRDDIGVMNVANVKVKNSNKDCSGSLPTLYGVIEVLKQNKNHMGRDLCAVNGDDNNNNKNNNKNKKNKNNSAYDDTEHDDSAYDDDDENDDVNSNNHNMMYSNRQGFIKDPKPFIIGDGY
jgi:hypothetical protein